MPSEIILIAAVTLDGFIARHSSEITKWTKDLPLFKEQTMGHPVIMGSNTFHTLSNELVGREVVVVHRNDDPREILQKVKSQKCFIAGGGKIYSRFYPFLTHLYITPHPYVFGKGVKLFSDIVNEAEVVFENLIQVNEKKGIYQYQYKVEQK